MHFNDSENCDHSIDDGSPSLNKLHQDGEEIKDPIEDVDLHAVGSLLPDDEDELLAGIMDDFDLSELPTQVEDLEDDLFGSGGGMELDFDIGISKLSLSDGVAGNGFGHYGLPNGVATVAGEHPYGEHPSRTLFVRNINSNVEDSELRTLFEVSISHISDFIPLNQLFPLANYPTVHLIPTNFYLLANNSQLVVLFTW